MFLRPKCPLEKAKNVTKITEYVDRNWSTWWNSNLQLLQANLVGIDLIIFFLNTVMDMCFTQFAIIWTNELH